jgi:hypothetical protein
MEKRNRRPWLVTFTAIGVFFIAAGSFLQTGLAVSQRNSLNSLPLSAPAWYFLLGGVLWGAAWLAVAVGIWRLRGRAITFALFFLPIYSAAWLADRLLFTRSPAIQNSIVFDLAIRLAGLVLGILVLLLSRHVLKKVQPPPSTHEG